MLEQLESQGFSLIPEVARAHIERELASGQTMDEIREDEAKFQRALIETKLGLEAAVPPTEVVFFDRAMPDSITYYRVAGLDPNDVLSDCFNFRYGHVFLFDRLPLEQDGVRTEDAGTAAFLDRWLERDYSALGYDVIRVPVMSVSDRVEFLLERIG